jgi:hypothetical protein
MAAVMLKDPYLPENGFENGLDSPLRSKTGITDPSFTMEHGLKEIFGNIRKSQDDATDDMETTFIGLVERLQRRQTSICRFDAQ